MSREKQTYPVGQQSFPELRKGGYLYVDKTQYIERILDGTQYYFLGRPRRFGKSLFLSTLRAFFEGRRELFKGLYADTMDWDWEPVPVLYLDLNTGMYRDGEDLHRVVDSFLTSYEEQYGIPRGEEMHSLRLARLIREIALKTGKNVVVLVDEYDKPLVNNIHDPERFEAYRTELSSLYSNFKSSADYLRLVFLTGVSRFGKLSVFSGLNNLRDISFSNKFAAICGITEQELLDNFKPGIKALSEEDGLSEEEELKKLKQWYDGYHFSAKSPDIYNPFSLLCTFSEEAYANYWISSGTPTLLVEALKRGRSDLETVTSAMCSQEELQGLDAENIRPIALLYQAGYLTIKGHLPEMDLYKVGLPNEEVTRGFYEFLLPKYAQVREGNVRGVVFNFLNALQEGDVDGFIAMLKSFFAGISYEMRLEEERNVQNALFVLFHLLGLNVDVAYRTSNGRIDILVRTRRFVYVIELKYDKSAREALEQILSKDYALPWGADGRKVIAIGLNYDSMTRRLSDVESVVGPQAGHAGNGA